LLHRAPARQGRDTALGGGEVDADLVNPVHLQPAAFIAGKRFHRNRAMPFDCGAPQQKGPVSASRAPFQPLTTLADRLRNRISWMFGSQHRLLPKSARSGFARPKVAARPGSSPLSQGLENPVIIVTYYCSNDHIM